MEKANKISEEKKGEMIKKAKEEIVQVIESEKAKMQIEKAKTLKEIKREVSELVIDSLEKILEEKIDLKKDKELIKKVVKNNL
jgi:F-type H+-transporting ATPase subunit b